jgi:hypothetical protein
VVTVDELAAFFRALNPDVGEAVKNGAHFEWIREVATRYDARRLVEALDRAPT